MNNYIRFYVDGARSLQNAIIERFAWLKNLGLVLDWYLLKKKCEMELSLSIKGKDQRNKFLNEVLAILWTGKLDKAIQYLRNIDKTNLKATHKIERLIGYFERNRLLIPCYALRKELGLKNSSNDGEKANDLAVAIRQKHNGMSWSKDGSNSLASITTLHLNKEQFNWYTKRNIDFKLVV